MKYASRAGEKLEFALEKFGVEANGLVCADFGTNTGGFVDCLLSHGARKVYAVETGYGVLDWKLRNSPSVVPMERTNAMRVVLPEKVDLLTIDVSWTRLEKILPNALQNLKPKGFIIVLLKPHYEAEPKHLRKGKLLEEFIPEVLLGVKKQIEKLNLQILGECESPIVGEKAGNKEFLLLLKTK
jgi:23S rRNA (cytidine1920-2'-O)/16S rRNA (cytidine1409-2'-O)-methyltransferase